MTKKVLILKGLPASGKSTYAKELLDKHPGVYKRINKDDLRAMLDNAKWSKQNEKFVLETRDFLITTALLSGFNVIIDDTNLAPKHEARIHELVNQFNSALSTSLDPVKAVVEVVDFTHISVEECIKRDLKRQNSVGERVIRQMYDQFLRKTETQPVIEGVPAAIICDIDGTLAEKGDRDIFDYTKVHLDLCKPAAKRVLELYPGKIIICSGREDSCRSETEAWLKQSGIRYDLLLMRKAGDHRKDAIIKREIFDAEIRGKYNIEFVLDDRDQVVAMWRDLGLVCLQVAYGNF